MSKNKRYSAPSYHSDKHNMEHEIDQPKGKSESTNKKDSTSRNNVDNDTMEYELEPTINRNESKGKNIQFLVIIYTTN